MKLLDKKQRLSTVPDIKDPSIPQIPTVQHAISGHTMQKDSPFHSGRKQDFDNEYGGHTLRPLQRILVSHPLSNTSFPNLTNTFQFSLKLLPYMYSIKKAILWLYLRPVQTAEEEEFTVLDVNCLSTNKSLRTRKASANNKYGVNHIVLLSDYHENRGYKPYLEIQMVPNRRKRSKRGVGLQCDATKVENRCCFKKIIEIWKHNNHTWINLDMNTDNINHRWTNQYF
ncbi:Hypothetical predicted protein [Octopus vulgaris]|uniref:Uncharacterized protein n=1 Tax=Octopus vulgaris TaxID=6645 RepID=A0AA36BW51_OCTVU|nr:Hypothetical predicted protein [Octopus vulgaris]